MSRKCLTVSVFSSDRIRQYYNLSNSRGPGDSQESLPWGPSWEVCWHSPRVHYPLRHPTHFRAGIRASQSHGGSQSLPRDEDFSLPNKERKKKVQWEGSGVALPCLGCVVPCSRKIFGLLP